MSVVVVSGACGLIGSETVEFFCNKGYSVVGIDNNLRKVFFGADGSVLWNKARLEKKFKKFTHISADIRNKNKMEAIFKKYATRIVLVVHTAAQPSHDWAARDPHMDFSVNANGTLVLLEAFRKFCPKAVFIFTSTNKVYGDRPNFLPLIETEKRFEIPADHQYAQGIDESMSIDNCLHSVFGASKVAADVMTQEYGRYFGLHTGIFRGGCLTGPSHSGAQLHGFLSYLVRCCITGRQYTVFGYKGKQVRDNIHSFDLVNAFYQFFMKPGCAQVYNMGGSRFANVSMLEAIEICERVCHKKMQWNYVEQNRIGDHMWWISDVRKFKSHYPQWDFTRSVEATIEEIYETQKKVLKT